jgi:hypothetical protein
MNWQAMREVKEILAPFRPKCDVYTGSGSVSRGEGKTQLLSPYIIRLSKDD